MVVVVVVARIFSGTFFLTSFSYRLFILLQMIMFTFISLSAV